MTHTVLTRPVGLLASALVVLASCRSDRRQPVATVGPPWLLARAQQEVEQAARSPAFHDFRFTDRREASGITFENRIVDDAGKAYKKVHYDHGSGLCAADVDGDGLPDLYFATQLGASELWKNVGGGRFANITDGTSMTFLIAECAGRNSPWFMGKLQPGASRSNGPWANNGSRIQMGGCDPKDPTAVTGPKAVNCINDKEIYAFHPAGANTGMCDGSIRFVSANLDLNIALALLTRERGEQISTMDF